MKFFNYCIALLFSSNVLSYTLVGKHFKRDVTINANQYDFSKLTENCTNDLKNFKQYYDCTGLVNITRNNFKDICKTFNSKKCQNVLKDPMSYIPNCKEYSLIKEMFSETAVNMRKAEMDVICNTDENGNLCPVGEIFVDYNKNHTETRNAVRNSCKSKKCNDVIIQALPKFLINTKKAENLSITKGQVDKKIDENVNEWINFLKSNECTDVYKNINSGATTFKINNVLLYAIILIFTFF